MHVNRHPVGFFLGNSRWNGFGFKTCTTEAQAQNPLDGAVSERYTRGICPLTGLWLTAGAGSPSRECYVFPNCAFLHTQESIRLHPASRPAHLPAPHNQPTSRGHGIQKPTPFLVRLRWGGSGTPVGSSRARAGSSPPHARPPPPRHLFPGGRQGSGRHRHLILILIFFPMRRQR